ncbi:MAG: hypothetical protein ACD_7C00581G0017 [uncultured bacterium]|nr:MAG: hypothetical protein ACD_7C00581G0017 [uncultured bacterium]HBR79992.1 hypothetical protein [Candidatus Moranbacteria bacterium]
MISEVFIWKEINFTDRGFFANQIHTQLVVVGIPNKEIVMPIGDVSGLMLNEKEAKSKIRKDLKIFFKIFSSCSEDDTTVTFIMDDTTGPEEHVMVRLYSKKFLKMSVPELEEMCDDIISVLEANTDHPFNEIIIPLPGCWVIRGRYKEVKKESLRCCTQFPPGS